MKNKLIVESKDTDLPSFHESESSDIQSSSDSIDIQTNDYSVENYTVFTLIVYSFIYVFELFFGYNINTNWIIKCISNIVGYFFHNNLIINSSINYNLYLQNVLKYISIFFCRNIISKLMIYNYNIFSFQNIFTTNIYILIYFIFDIIFDITIEDTNKKKHIISDVGKTLFGFIIVETLVNKKIDVNDYIYILVLSFGTFIYYNHLDIPI